MPHDARPEAAPEAGTNAASADADSPRDGAAIEGSAESGLPEGGIGYMVEIKTNSAPTGPATVEAWLGRPVDVAGTTITTTSYIGSGTAYTTSSGAHPLLECSFPLLSIFGESNNLSDLGQAASRAYDTTYEAMSMALAAWPNPLLSVRIGWEFNGNWYKWSNGAATHSTYANYVAAFKRAAALVRKHNPHVLIQWNIAWGQPDPTPYWPGAYDPTNNPGGVDVVSMDFYKAERARPRAALRQARRGAHHGADRPSRSPVRGWRCSLRGRLRHPRLGRIGRLFCREAPNRARPALAGPAHVRG